MSSAHLCSSSSSSISEMFSCVPLEWEHLLACNAIVVLAEVMTESA